MTPGVLLRRANEVELEAVARQRELSKLNVRRGVLLRGRVSIVQKQMGVVCTLGVKLEARQ